MVLVNSIDWEGVHNNVKNNGLRRKLNLEVKG
jgi:hypothetical protein